MRVEPITPETLDAALTWWDARGEGVPPRDVLPPDGAVALDDSGPLAVAFLYRPDGCSVVIVDWLVTRPGLDAATARSACRGVARSLCHWAALDGRRHVFASVFCDAMLREAQNAGFRVAATGCTHLVKHLS